MCRVVLLALGRQDGGAMSLVIQAMYRAMNGLDQEMHRAAFTAVALERLFSRAISAPALRYPDWDNTLRARYGRMSDDDLRLHRVALNVVTNRPTAICSCCGEDPHTALISQDLVTETKLDQFFS